MTKFLVKSGDSGIEFSTRDAAEDYCNTKSLSYDLIVEIEEDDPDTSFADEIKALRTRKAFAVQSMDNFNAECRVLGIVADGMLTAVRKVMSNVWAALALGDLEDSVREIEAIPEENKDATYVTDERLTALVDILKSLDA